LVRLFKTEISLSLIDASVGLGTLQTNRANKGYQ